MDEEEDKVMERRFSRNSVRVPVDLVFGDLPGGPQSPASVVDVSEGGLRVQTGPSLIPGGLLQVFYEGKKKPFARCRVVWATTHGSAVPSEAGLEILDLVDGPSHKLMGFTALTKTTDVN